MFLRSFVPGSRTPGLGSSWLVASCLALLVTTAGCRQGEDAGGEAAPTPVGMSEARPSAPAGPTVGTTPVTTPVPTAVSRAVTTAVPDPVPESNVARSDAPRGSGPFPRPAALRGLYVNAWAAGARARFDTLLAVADSTEINALVIDIKDASGYVSHASGVDLVREVGATGQIRIRDLPGLLARVRAAGLYPIARIVVARDPVLAAARPEWAIQDAGGGAWRDAKGDAWLNLWAPGVLEYHLALAREVAALGFPEVQWDYIRFPDAPAAVRSSARFPGAVGRQAEAVEHFLAAARQVLSGMGVRSTADVFGVTTSARHDVGVGQVWDVFIDDVDAALPMVYPSHFAPGSHGVDRPDHHPYEIVRASLESAVVRNRAIAGAGGVVPWLQDFTRGRGAAAYGPAEVRAQIQAVYDAGLREWVLWNSGSQYTVAALEPDRGWSEEPRIRVGGRVVPVSRRGEIPDPAEPARR